MAERLLGPLASARRAQGEFHGVIAHLGFGDKGRIELDARTEEAVQTADIEGEPVSRVAVRSSIARRLHLDDPANVQPDAATQGLVDMTMDATQEYAAPLTIERIHAWHAGLFPAGTSAGQRIAVGTWRDDTTGPMQVVSGRIDRPTVHFEAPPAARIPAEMRAFLRWFEGPVTEDGLLRSAIAHFWFVTIHPYDDGNGRIARAIADMALARDEKSGRRFLSMSQQINEDKKQYYDALERAQHGTADITDWLAWFLGCYSRAVDKARAAINDTFRAQAFWQSHQDVAISDRQRRVIVRYLQGFEGALTTKKWAVLAKISADTAQRDIADLLAKGVLVKKPGGSKNTNYALAGY